MPVSHSLFRIRTLLFIATMALSANVVAVLPGDSVLQLPATFTDQDGNDFQLADRAGHVQLVSIFYTSCTYTCPLMIDSGRAVERALTAEQRDRLRILLVSFDPQRDTPQVLNALAKQRKLDSERWTLARASDDDVRKLAGLLGVRYRKLANGDFNHTTGLILLDADGRVLARTDQLGSIPEADFLKAVKAALDVPEHIDPR